MDGWGAGWGWFAMGHVLWWVLLLVAIAALVRWTLGHGPHRSQGGSDRALDLLRERYARGEIDQQEFEARKRVLGG
jgi:putative membrane protein